MCEILASFLKYLIHILSIFEFSALTFSSITKLILSQWEIPKIKYETWRMLVSKSLQKAKKINHLRLKSKHFNLSNKLQNYNLNNVYFLKETL